MTELPSRTSPSRSPLPNSTDAAAVAASRSPIPPPLELSLGPRHHLLRTATYLLFGAALVTAGWMLLPHGNSRETTAERSRIRYQEPNRLSNTEQNSANLSLPSPPAAVIAVRDSESDPREPGLRHITTLQLAGSFSEAADYAVAAPLEYRRDFTIAAYHEWGRHHPDQAIASAVRIEEAFTRDFAMHSVLSGWARNDPEGMAEAALAFPDSDFKKAALTRALRAWMIKDPNLAGDWIMTHPDVVPVAEEMFRKDRR
ncbi:MAG: hypothetical protein QM715_02425 [Nibricoccus sp.]